MAEGSVEAIASDPDFEIITTLAYSKGLPLNPTASVKTELYLLQHGIDRLEAAASDLSWVSAVQYLTERDRTDSLANQIHEHMASTHGKSAENAQNQFIVRLAFRKDAKLRIVSGPRPFNPKASYYPLSLSREPMEGFPLIPVYLDCELTKPSALTKHKTTYRVPYNEAWSRVGLDETVSPAECDVLLQNELGHIMGAVFRTVYFWRDGRFVTPSSHSGCKLGVSRRWAVENAGVEEGTVESGQVRDGEVIWLSSAVGGFIQGQIRLSRKE